MILHLCNQYVIWMTLIMKFYELKNENFVGLYDTIPIRVMVDKYCMNTAGFTPNYVFKFHEDFATIHRVSQNGGVAILTKKYYTILKSKWRKAVYRLKKCRLK